MRRQLEKGKVYVHDTRVMNKEEILAEIENLKQVESLLGWNDTFTYLQRMEIQRKLQSERERLEQLIDEIEGQ